MGTPLDRNTIQLFRTFEAVNGLKFIESMARGIPMGSNASTDPKAVLHMAQLAKQYLLEVHQATLVLSEKQVLDLKRMERYVRECEAREKAGKAPPPRWTVPVQPSKRSTEAEWQRRYAEVRQRDAQRAAEPVFPPSKPRKPGQPSQYVYVRLDGQRCRVHRDLLPFLEGKVTLDG